jgi:DNA-binding transcriptional ArsR family regulator
MAVTKAAHEPRLARVAALVADASRARMLCYLLGGEYASAGELARAAGVGAATASAHLAQLLDAGLLACDPRGRHRYYRIADGDVAHALEALAMVSERDSHARAWASPARLRLRTARCCYGHLAGRAGVGLLQVMIEKRWLERTGVNAFEVTDRGVDALSALGLDGADWQRRSKASTRIAYGCLDWSERRDHLAGKLAGALLLQGLARDWLRPRPGERRALGLTAAGQQALAAWLPPEVLAEAV